MAKCPKESPHNWHLKASVSNTELSIDHPKNVSTEWAFEWDTSLVVGWEGQGYPYTPLKRAGAKELQGVASNQLVAVIVPCWWLLTTAYISPSATTWPLLASSSTNWMVDPQGAGSTEAGLFRSIIAETWMINNHHENYQWLPKWITIH